MHQLLSILTVVLLINVTYGKVKENECVNTIETFPTVKNTTSCVLRDLNLASTEKYFLLLANPSVSEINAVEIHNSKIQTLAM